MSGSNSPIGPALRQAASDADNIAADLAAVLPRLHAAHAQITKLIGGAAGREDTTMATRLTEAAALTGRAASELRKTATTARRLAANR